MDPILERKEALFDAARQLASLAERTAYLDAACGDDPELRRQVEGMLADEAAAPEFFRAIDALGDSVRGLAVETPAESVGQIAEGPGTVIGRYTLIERIGEGGFGVVYLAKQKEPVARQVALKIIKPGLDTREVVARFEAERQALALMDHPNIARVLDGGATGTGRPYFVMDLVRGLSITEYCDTHRLPPRQRLELFIQVCQAVQHAHQKGIIHRDLKPSNVLVAQPEPGRPGEPKVIDFGIAKALNQRLTARTLVTRPDQLMGTPDYMSPEQADGSGVDVDTRSDIYSLGALLYELLTGTPPFERETLKRCSLEEIRRMIRETEPPKPSTRLTVLVAADVKKLTSKSALRTPQSEIERASLRRRLQETREFINAVRGDLDWIVMKCLEKDRTRRYETANGLAVELRRYLNHEPVSAVAPSARYRLGKFVRRNRTALAIAAGIVVLMVGATLLSGWLALRMNQARKAADAAAAKAREEADISKAINRFWNYEILGAANPFQGKQMDITVREAMNIATEKVGEKYAHRPKVEVQIRSTLANSYRILGDHARAKDQYQRLLELQTRILGEEGYKEVVRLLLQTADNCRQLRDYQAAELYVDNALAVVEAHQAQDSLLTAHCQEILAGVYFHRFEPAKMLAVMVPAVRRLEADRASPDVDLGSSYHNLGIAYDWLERKEEALHYLEKGRDLKAQRQPQGIALGRSLLTLAGNYYPLERYEEADALVARALNIYDLLTGRNHYDLYSHSGALVQFLARQSQFDQTEQFLQEAREFLRTYRYTNSYDLTANLAWTAEFHQARTRFAEAEGILTNLLQNLDPHSDPFYGYSDPTVRGLASSVYAQQEKWGAAREVLSRIYRPNAEHWCQRALFELQTGDEPAYRETCRQLLQQFADWDDRYALIALLPTLALRAQTFPPNQTETLRRWQRRLAEHPAILGPITRPRIHLALGMIAYRLGQFPEAIAHLKHCLDASEHYRGLAELFLALSYDELPNRSQALDFFRRAGETMSHMPQPGSRNLGRHWMQVAAYHLLKNELQAASK